MAHDTIDNRNEKRVDHVSLILDATDRALFAVGYFFLTRFTSIAKELQNLTELRLLIGNTSTRETIEQLTEGYKALSAIENAGENFYGSNQNYFASLTKIFSHRILPIVFLHPRSQNTITLEALKKLCKFF